MGRYDRASPKPPVARQPLPLPAPLRVASWNLENFSAADPARTARIARCIVDDLQCPHIIAVQEMMGDASADPGHDPRAPKHDTTATKNAQAVIDAILQAKGVPYLYCDVPPQDGKDGGKPNSNIRCGFFYRPERVVLPDSTALGENPYIVGKSHSAFKDMRKPVIAQFIDLATLERYHVINVHLTPRKRVNSEQNKRMTHPLTPKQIHHINAKRNHRRQRQMAVITDASDILMAQRENPDSEHVIVCGDFNQGTELLQPLRTLGFTTPGDGVAIPSRVYSQDQQEVIDHIALSPELAKRMAHITRIPIVDRTEEGHITDHNPTIVAMRSPERAKATAIALTAA